MLSALPGGPLASFFGNGGGHTVFAQQPGADQPPGLSESDTSAAASESPGFFDILEPSIVVTLIVLVLFSAFFSASEVAFFSIHRVRMRQLRESGSVTGTLVAQMMEHRNRLLTTILVGNSIVNVFIGVLLPTRLEEVLRVVVGMPKPIAYVLTVALSTYFLILFGEITPKVFAVQISETYSKAAVMPLRVVDWLISPLRWAIIHFTDFFFRITRFEDIKAAPFITDDEFKTVLSDSEAQGVIAANEREMIKGIVEFGDARVREILVPRPDIVAIEENCTLAEALEMFREHEYSRMPVYREDIDHITGVLFAKDLLTSVMKNNLKGSVRAIARRPYFVPETMTVRGFVEDAQRRHTHLAVVVDEFGGTEGVVTLEDAIEEVVGEIEDEDEKHEVGPIEQIDESTYRVDGGLPLDELAEAVGLKLEDEEHKTIAALFMERTNKIPEQGDQLEYDGAIFVVESVAGMRAETFIVRIVARAHDEEHE